MAAKFIPRILMPDQMQQCAGVCPELQQLALEDETLS